MNDFSYSVYRSLMKRKLILGLPPFLLIATLLIMAIFFIALESLVIIPFGICFIYLLGLITKKDEYLIEIFLNSLLQPDILN